MADVSRSGGSEQSTDDSLFEVRVVGWTHYSGSGIARGGMKRVEEESEASDFCLRKDFNFDLVHMKMRAVLRLISSVAGMWRTTKGHSSIFTPSSLAASGPKSSFVGRSS